MPYAIHIDEARRGFITSYSGVLTTEEFLQCTAEKFKTGEEFLSAEFINSFKYSLSDLSAVTKFEVTLEALKANASLSEQAMRQSNSGVMIVVAPADLEYGLGRLWQTYAETGEERVKLFRNRQEADTWIAETFG